MDDADLQEEDAPAEGEETTPVAAPIDPHAAAEAEVEVFGAPELGRGERARLLAEISIRLGLGQDDDEIATALDLPDGRYLALKRELDDREVQALSAKSTEETFVDYLRQKKRILRGLRELEQSVVLVPGKGSAPVSTPDARTRLYALKAQSDILDGMITVGQKLGILEKAPEKKQIFAGIAIRELDNTGLRRRIFAEIQQIRDVVKRYGDTDLFGNPISSSEPVPQLEAGSDDPADEVFPAPRPAPRTPRRPVAPERAPPAPPPPKFSEDSRPFFARGAASRKQGAVAKKVAVRRTRATKPPPV